MIKLFFAGFIILTGVGVDARDSRPNILFVISDDQSYPHASAYGSEFIDTPAFDRIADEGVLFTNAFSASPGCSPSRAAILTGRYPWQLEEAGTHASYFPNKFTLLPDLLQEAGYHVGYTGKGWGPGDWEASGWERNPAGPAFQGETLNPPYRWINETDYAANFQSFLEQRSA
ncbi:MAG: sulfatase-like hydrolase/transferase, partial [Balneolaceae bacterium]|nr:sulfatase-like hydrolase/transferase [Balneolaceae bacterium]